MANFQGDVGIDDEFYFERHSNATCKLNEIQGIILGGLSSRFWMLRKQINHMNVDELESLPFYSWQCITLQLKRRDIDLVIKE